MPRSPGQVLDQIRLRDAVYKLCWLRGYSQATAAQQLGLTSQRVSQLLDDGVQDFRDRVRLKAKNLDSAERLQRRLDQYQATREEAWLAWERSKEDATCTTTEQQLRTIYETVFENGEKKRVPTGEKMLVVKAITRVEGRLPQNAYLATVLNCLRQESELENLVEAEVVKIYNNNSNQVAVALDWGRMTAPSRPGPDPVEAKIAAASSIIGEQPPAPAPNSGSEPASFLHQDVGKISLVQEQPLPNGWSDKEAEELGDGEHLNGDGA